MAEDVRGAGEVDALNAVCQLGLKWPGRPAPVKPQFITTPCTMVTWIIGPRDELFQTADVGSKGQLGVHNACRQAAQCYGGVKPLNCSQLPVSPAYFESVRFFVSSAKAKCNWARRSARRCECHGNQLRAKNIIHLSRVARTQQSTEYPFPLHIACLQEIT